MSKSDVAVLVRSLKEFGIGEYVARKISLAGQLLVLCAAYEAGLVLIRAGKNAERHRKTITKIAAKILFIWFARCT
ncbi:MAG: hypothetical protein ACREBS_07395 [Nitrososphaerales archaeon]